jgi:hypothetical protein
MAERIRVQRLGGSLVRLWGPERTHQIMPVKAWLDKGADLSADCRWGASPALTWRACHGRREPTDVTCNRVPMCSAVRCGVQKCTDTRQRLLHAVLESDSPIASRPCPRRETSSYVNKQRSRLTQTCRPCSCSVPAPRDYTDYFFCALEGCGECGRRRLVETRHDDTIV